MLNLNSIATKYDMEYGGELASAHNVSVISRPNIPKAKKRIDYIDIPGRNGSLTKDNDTYEDIEFPVGLNFIDDPNKWGMRERDITEWLEYANPKILQFTDDADVFYKVKGVEIGTIDRTSKRIGKLSPTFRCDPFVYYVSGTYPIDNPETLTNTHHPAEPIYTISGTGSAEITVNGHTVGVEVVNSVTLDISRLISYRTVSGVMVNTDTDGDLSGLILSRGENTISVTSGFDLTVIPNWRSV